jgi:hypothetical protein
MNMKTIELKEFTERFVPFFEAEFEKEVANAPDFWDEDARRLWAYYELFPEALQNFADRVCEKQREICAGYYFDNIPYEYHENWMYNGILEAEQPKIEELCMTNKEAKEIAISLLVLLDSILSGKYNPEEVANDAICATDIIKNNPKVKEWVERFFECDPDSPDFSEQWDRQIACLRFLERG